MTSQAEQVRDTFNKEQYMALSFEYGFATTYDRETINFPSGNKLKEKRNSRGRVSFCLLEYTDGSQLSFKYSDDRDAAVAVVRKALNYHA